MTPLDQEIMASPSRLFAIAKDDQIIDGNYMGPEYATSIFNQYTREFPDDKWTLIELKEFKVYNKGASK